VINGPANVDLAPADNAAASERKGDRERATS
jgi:hypothetical protein